MNQPSLRSKTDGTAGLLPPRGRACNLDSSEGQKESYPRLIQQTRLVNKNIFRTECGMISYNKYGYLMDECISHLIDRFADWVIHPTGDRSWNIPNATSMVLSDNTRFLYVGSDGRNKSDILCFDLSSDLIVDQLIGHTTQVECMDYKNDILVSGTDDGCLHIWQTKPDHQLIRRLVGHSRTVMAISMNESLIISCSFDDSVRMWSLQSGKCLRTITFRKCEIQSVLIVSDFTFATMESYRFRLWNHDGEEINKKEGSGLKLFSSLALSKDGSMIAFTQDNKVILMDACTLKDIYQFTLVGAHYLAFHPSKPDWIAFYSGRAKMITIWDCYQNGPIISHSVDDCLGIAFNGDGSKLVVTSDCSIQVYQIPL